VWDGQYAEESASDSQYAGLAVHIATNVGRKGPALRPEEASSSDGNFYVRTEVGRAGSPPPPGFGDRKEFRSRQSTGS
jgi:hypothetical protein